MFAGLFISTVPSEDPIGAAAFEEALKKTTPAEAADAMGVGLSQITRWRQAGNIPHWRARKLPEEARVKYFELVADEAGVCVVPRDVLGWVFSRVMGYERRRAQVASSDLGDRPAAAGGQWRRAVS